MAITYVAGNAVFDTVSDTTVATTTTIDVDAGDLIVAYVTWQSGDSTISINDNLSGNPFTMLGTSSRGGVCYGCFGYVLSAANNDTATFTVTLGTARDYKGIAVMVFDPAGDTVTLEADSPKPATGVSSDPWLMTSGVFSSLGSNTVIIGGCSPEANQDYSNPLIGADAATALLEAGLSGTSEFTAMWYKIYAAAQTSITAKITGDNDGNWVTDICGFKATAGAGGTTTGRASSSTSRRRRINRKNSLIIV